MTNPAALRSPDLLNFYRHISQQPLTIVDVETSGYKPENSRVIEVAILQASLAEGIHHQETHLINPQITLPSQIIRFTGISQAMVNQAPPPEEIWPPCLAQLNEGILTAHNLSFDYGFIQSEFRKLATAFSRSPDQQFCTVILSRLMLPELPSRSLPDLVKHFGFAVGRSHRAAADTQACWLLAQRLLTELLGTEEAELLPRFAQQWLPLGDAAVLLGCSSSQARSRLTQAGIAPRIVGQYKTAMYRRGAVESLDP
jgi:DNA polymerase III subunit epsilon